MLVIAHRGSNCIAFENSWEAFETSIRNGVDRIELDVQLTKDEEVVVFHDKNLRRVFRTSHQVESLTRSEYKDFKLPNGEFIPFLDQVLQRLLPKVELNIELKSTNIKLADQVYKLIHRNRYQSKIIISSFSMPLLLRFKELTDRIRVACLWGGDLPVVGRLTRQSALSMMNKLETSIIHPNMKLVNKKFMDMAQENNWAVYTWASLKGTESPEKNIDLWDNLYHLGVDGHCTNYPEEMIKWRESILR